MQLKASNSLGNGARQIVSFELVQRFQPIEIGLLHGIDLAFEGLASIDDSLNGVVVSFLLGLGLLHESILLLLDVVNITEEIFKNEMKLFEFVTSFCMRSYLQDVVASASHQCFGFHSEHCWRKAPVTGTETPSTSLRTVLMLSSCSQRKLA